MGLEYILGVQPTLDGLRIDPCIPARWKQYSVQRRWRGTTYHITVKNPDGICKGNVALRVDGRPVAGNTLKPGGGGTVKVVATMMAR